MKGSKGLSKVSEIYEDRSRRIKELKAEGRKVIGYTCIYVPVEILNALGLIPYRIFGDIKEPITQADRVLPTSFCPFMRNCLDSVYKGKYDFLDGIVGVHSCDPQEKTCHIWKSTKNYPFFPYIDIPATTHEWSLKAFKGVLNDFVKNCQSFSKKKFSLNELKESIGLYNQQRALVRELYELRKSEPPLISGVETLQVMVALESIPVEEGNELVKEVITEVKGRKKDSEKKHKRILIWGGSIDNVTLVQLIEDYDANLVMDDNCVGSRKYFSDVKLVEDPIEGLAQHYLKGLPVPRTFKEAVVGEAKKDRMADLTARFGYIGNYIKEWKVDGVIFQLVRFCDPHAYELVDIEDYVDSLGIPNIYLEHDYTEGSLAPLRTRVQAFLEQLPLKLTE